MDIVIGAIIEGIVSLLIGFFGGYSIGIKKSNMQRARDNSNLFQIGEINNGK